MSTYPAARSNIRATVKTTAAIINLVIIIILDEIYAAIARWLTTLGETNVTVKGLIDSQTKCFSCLFVFCFCDYSLTGAEIFLQQAKVFVGKRNT